MSAPPASQEHFDVDFAGTVLAGAGGIDGDDVEVGAGVVGVANLAAGDHRHGPGRRPGRCPGWG